MYTKQWEPVLQRHGYAGIYHGRAAAGRDATADAEDPVEGCVLLYNSAKFACRSSISKSFADLIPDDEPDSEFFDKVGKTRRHTLRVLPRNLPTACPKHWRIMNSNSCIAIPSICTPPPLSHHRSRHPELPRLGMECALCAQARSLCEGAAVAVLECRGCGTQFVAASTHIHWDPQVIYPQTSRHGYSHMLPLAQGCLDVFHRPCSGRTSRPTRQAC